MKYEPLPTQISGAQFLASRQYAMLADEPRVGKTGAAIIGADLIVAQRILIITTKSGRAVWQHGMADWQIFDRKVVVFSKATVAQTERVKKALLGPCAIIVSWNGVTDAAIRAVLMQAPRWCLILPDEDHYAKNFDSKRAQALYGKLVEDGRLVDNTAALYPRSKNLWQLTGTPYPHDLSDGYTRLRAVAPHLLRANRERGWPDVTTRDDFKYRYCIVRMKKISNFNKIPVVIGGKNEDEFRARFGGYFLARTQQDVGIQPPTYDMLPLLASEQVLREIDGLPGVSKVMAAIEATLRDDPENPEAIKTRDLDMHLGPLMRFTGEIKARAVVEALAEEFACGLDKIVLAYWHKNVGDILQEGLREYGVVKVDGSVAEDWQREAASAQFSKPAGPRVFLGQIAAAGEAIDLSASAELWFVEQVISPKGMSQMSKRITNHTQTRTPRVKVCTLVGSVDEAIQTSLMRLWVSINKGTREQ